MKLDKLGFALVVVLCAGVCGFRFVRAQGAAPRANKLLMSAWDSKRKQYLTDLQPNEIRLREEGKVQALSSVNPARDIPLAIGLLLDASGSRVNEFPGAEGGPAIALVRRLVKGGSRGFVASFNDNIWAQTDLVSDPESLARAIDKVVRSAPKGGSAILDSISFCAEKLFVEKEIRKVLVVVSNGDDNASRGPLNSALESLISELQKKNVTVHVLTIRSAPWRSRESSFKLGERLAESTGGKNYAIGEVKDMERAFEEIGGSD